MKKRMKNTIMIALLLCMCLSACGRDHKEEGAVKDNNSNSEVSVSDTDQDKLYGELFDIHNKIEIHIDITGEELMKLQEDYWKYASMGSKSPIYRDTALAITITTSEGSNTYEFENVGIRMKGNTSRTDFYNEEEGMYNLIHFRLEFPEKFAGLEHLEMRWNKLDDSTYIREYYTYEFFRDSGILAPRTNLASVDVADIHAGVFTIYEPVDKIFIERNLKPEDRDGDLYKAGWLGTGATLTMDTTYGIENEDNCEFYHYDLKNNKKTSQHELMQNLLAKLNAPDLNKDTLEEIVDMDYFLKFAAVSYFVGNPDDIRNDYNNYYIYFLKSNNKAVFIPYDNDRCFGVTKEWNPTWDAMTSVNPFSTMADGAVCHQENPLFIHTVDAGGWYIDEYANVLKEVSTSPWLTTDKFNELYEIAYNHYKDDAMPSKTFYNASEHKFKFDNSYSEGLGSDWGNASFADYIEAIMANFETYIAQTSQYYEYVDMNPFKEENPSGQENPSEEDTNIEEPGVGYYIRGWFNSWEIDEHYRMSYDASADVYSYTIEVWGEEWFKVGSGDNVEWYGYENVTASSEEVSFNEEHYDIVLMPGKYEILFHGGSKMIEINKI